MQAQSALTLERGLCTWSSLYFTSWLELARFDLLARNGLCAMAGLTNQCAFIWIPRFNGSILTFTLSLLLRELTPCLLGHGACCTMHADW